MRHEFCDHRIPRQVNLHLFEVFWVNKAHGIWVIYCDGRGRLLVATRLTIAHSENT